MIVVVRRKHQHRIETLLVGKFQGVSIHHTVSTVLALTRKWLLAGSLVTGRTFGTIDIVAGGDW